MKILLDTHIAIWAVLDSEELSNTARAMILDENNEIYYSTASVWEITIKHMAHPETFLFSGKYLEKGCEENGFVSLPVFNKHVAELESLVRPKDAPRCQACSRPRSLHHAPCPTSIRYQPSNA